MPNYKNVPVLSSLMKVLGAKEKGTVTEEQIITTATQILKQCSLYAAGNIKIQKEYVAAAHASCKKNIAAMEKLVSELEDIDYIPEIYKLGECKSNLDMIKLQDEAVAKDELLIYPLMKDWRSNWEATLEKVVPDISIAAPYQTIKAQTILEGRQIAALGDRIKEYVKRAEQLYNRAVKARKGGEAGILAVSKEANELLKGITDAEVAAGKLAHSAKTLPKQVKVYETYNPFTAKELKIAEGCIANGEGYRKTVSGHLKTATQFGKAMDALVKDKPGNEAVLKTRIEKKETALAAIEKHLEDVEALLATAKENFEVVEKRKFTK